MPLSKLLLEIKINHLTKKYHKICIIDNYTNCLNNQKVNFLIGDNGSGKTTLIKCILNLVKYQGTITTNCKEITYVPEKVLLPDYISIIDFLLIMAKVKKVNNYIHIVNEYLEKFDLVNDKYQKIINLSKGMKQKVVLIQALMTESDAYIFDEPLSGLDHNMQTILLDAIKGLNKKGKLIIIATHKLNNYQFRNKNIIKLGEQSVIS